MLSEIGSNFWLDPKDDLSGHGDIMLADFGLVGTDSVLLSTGRGAEEYVLREIERRNEKLSKVALIPPYTCETVIEPFLRLGYEIHTYLINEQLHTTAEMLGSSIRQSSASVVLLHNHFGFNTLDGCEDVIRTYSQKGVVFVEDRTQCIFSSFDALPVDYFVGSLRKWAALPDGGYAVCSDGQFPNKPSCYDQALTEAKIRASVAKYQYLFNDIGDKASFLEMYSAAETILDEENTFFSISPVSKSVFCSLDIAEVKEKRRQNYQALHDALIARSDMKIVLGEPTDNTVPLYFVLKTKHRKELQNFLRNNQIYAPIVWPRTHQEISVCKDAETLYEQALCIPIDQRYDLEDMQHIVKCINQFGMV